MLEGILRSADALLRAPADDLDVLLRGTAASAGRATGPARVVRDTSEFARVRPGDVLVCPATTPAWTLLFARVAAIVTDTSSPSSHASIVAREYGIPAVVGTGDATARVRDGQLLTVDGAAGTVALGTGVGSA
ncbi:MAG: PEP-utilizing enzyme [Chloroflexota bacterium]|nr:PEP-utilizing enzyme [Chloroflexota bacterium]